MGPQEFQDKCDRTGRLNSVSFAFDMALVETHYNKTKQFSNMIKYVGSEKRNPEFPRIPFWRPYRQTTFLLLKFQGLRFLYFY